AIEELLRYDGSVERALDRHVTEDFELHGHTIRRGEIVSLLLSSANHDPAKFDRAETFDIHRAPNPHIAFGKGMHHCLGAPLARLEAEIALNAVLRRLRGLRLAIREEDIRWRIIPGFRGIESLPVAWDV
ncbi:MAG TPA: cytochrome P450, partial [Polyangiaceae bacterium]